MAQQRQSPTRSGLLPEARRLVLPKGIVSSEFPRYRETCRSFGVTFDGWQTDLNRCWLGKSADGLYAADTVGLSIARQVGKTFDVGAIEFADCIIYPNTTVVWTAHRFKVARETFNELRALAKSPKLTAHLEYDDITTAAGNEMIPFRNGSRIVFAARERGAIRGFTKVRKLILDEAQILTEAALSDLAPTMNQAVNPQIILMGTPPKPNDPSEVWTRLRAEALAGESEGVLWVEIGADPGSDPDDRQAWRKANPSYPARTPARAIQRLRKLLSTEDFLREALGIWDEDDGKHRVIPAAVWNPLRADAPEDSPSAFAVDMTWDREWATVGVAVGGYVDVVEHRRGASWVVETCKKLQAVHDAPVVLTKGPADSLLEPLREAGVRVEELSSDDYRLACGAFFDAVTDGSLSHSGHPALDAAVAGAVVTGGSGGWVWDRKKGAVISPLVAVTLAWHQAQGGREPRVRSL